MRHRLVSVLVIELALCGIAQAQPVPTVSASEDVTINLDALNEPNAPKAVATPAVQTLPPIQDHKSKAKPTGNGIASAKRLPAPRQKPALQTAMMVVPPTVTAEPVAPVKHVSKSRIIVATPPAEAEMPVTILENSPVEMHGIATDPFASKKVINPVAGFQILSRVRFAQGESHIPNTAPVMLDTVAQQLIDSKKRIRLAAFSGNAGDMSSQSRRLSLERANAVRAYLVSKGVAFDHVDIMPYAGANDGEIDRVDVLASRT